MEPWLVRHPTTLPATPDTGKEGANYFCTLQQFLETFITFVNVLKGKWTCQHLCWACQLIPLTLKTGFGPGPLFFSLNQELSDQEAESCCIDEKTVVRSSDTTFAESGSPLRHQSRAESRWCYYRPAVDETHLYQGGKITLCDGWVTLWLLEVLVLSRMAVGLFSSDFTHIWLLAAVFCLWTIKLFQTFPVWSFQTHVHSLGTTRPSEKLFYVALLLEDWSLSQPQPGSWSSLSRRRTTLREKTKALCPGGVKCMYWIMLVDC